jgi:hypothetical protein
MEAKWKRMQRNKKSELAATVEEILKKLEENRKPEEKEDKASSVNDKMDIRGFIYGKTKKQFIEIKEDAGLENNTEAMRYIISAYYKLKFGDKT